MVSLINVKWWHIRFYFVPVSTDVVLLEGPDFVELGKSIQLTCSVRINILSMKSIKNVIKNVIKTKYKQIL